MVFFSLRLACPLGACALSVGAGLLFLLLTPRAYAANERLQVGDAVRFTLHTTRGRLTTDALEGRTYAVVFWNTGSKKFAQSLPHLRKLVNERDPQDFVLVGYSVDESVNKTHRAIAEGKMRWPQALHAEQDFPFYDLFYTRRSPVPGAFLVSDTGQLHWFGPLSQLIEQVQAVLPATPGAIDPRAAGVAAAGVYRELLVHPPHNKRVLERLRDIPDAAWEHDLGVRLNLRRAARRLTRMDEQPLLALRQAAAANKSDAQRFDRLWALRPVRRPAEPETAHATTDANTDPDSVTDPADLADPAASAAAALAAARAAEDADDLLTAWEHYHAAAEDPDAGPHGQVAKVQLRRLEDQVDFAQRMTHARRERAAHDLYVKALNLIAAGHPRDADTTLREIRRNYHDTAKAPAAERMLAQLNLESDADND